MNTNINFFGVSNFRIFEEDTILDLKPLTILTGKNGSGKSTLTSALMILSEWIKRNGYDITPAKNLFETDFSNYYEAVKNINKNEEQIVYFISIKNYIETKKLLTGILIFQKLNNNYTLNSFKVEDDKNEILFEILFNIEVIKIRLSNFFLTDFVSKTGYNKFPFSEILKNKNVDYKGTFTIEKGNNWKVRKKLEPDNKYKKLTIDQLQHLMDTDPLSTFNDYILIEEKNHWPMFYDLSLSMVINNFTFQFENTKWENMNDEEEKMNLDTLTDPINLKLKDYFNDDFFELLEKDIVKFRTTNSTVNILKSIRKSISTLVLDNLSKYVNIYSIKKNDFLKSNFYSGDNEANQLIYFVKEINYNDYYKPVKNFIRKYLEIFGIGKNMDVMEYENGIINVLKITDLDENVLNVNDLGWGHAKLLTILLKIGAIAAKEKSVDINFSKDPTIFKPSTLILEEPEANIHPALQGKLADLFADANKMFNIQFIVESHSEYLVRKIQYLVAKGELYPGDAIIYYFNGKQDTCKANPTCITIDESGGLSDDFGKGFFDEADNLAIDLYSLLTSNRKN